MFTATNAAFKMFNNAVANRDVPTDYYRGGMYNGVVKAFSNSEPHLAAIAETPRGWGLYAIGRGDGRPMFGLYTTTPEEIIDFADGLV